MRSRYFEQSMTSDTLTDWPLCEVPPPRGVTTRPASRQTASARSASLVLRGTTTPSGTI